MSRQHTRNKFISNRGDIMLRYGTKNGIDEWVDMNNRCNNILAI
jgi:hypothetical protein